MLLEALQVLLAPLMKPVSVLIGVISLLQSLAATCSGPTSTAYLTIHNRTVNMDGRPGHNNPIDLLMEHYNLYIPL